MAMSRPVVMLVIGWVTSQAFDSQEKCSGAQAPAVTASSLAQFRSRVKEEAFRLEQADDEFAEKMPESSLDRQTVPAEENEQAAPWAEETDERASSLATSDSHEALDAWKRVRGSAMWQHALTHVNFDEALLLQHLQRIETQHLQRAATNTEDAMNTTGCNFAEIKKDALQMDKLQEVDNSWVDLGSDALAVSGAALALAGAFPQGAAVVGIASGVHGVLGTVWRKANPAIGINDVRKECTQMLDKQGEKIVALMNKQMGYVSQCVGELRGHVNTLFNALTHFNFLSDEGQVQRGYASLMMQMAGGVTNKDFIANAVDRNLGHCSNVANYRKWLEKEKTVKLELLKILPIALTWMKVCEKLSLDFITLLKQNIPFTETYVETVNIQVASSFVSFMDAATKYTHLRWYYYSAKNYRAYLYMMKAHRVNKARSFPKRQPRKGGMWHSRHAAFCRRWGSNRADNHRHTTNWGVWETRDSEHRCLDTGGWWSGGGSRHNLYYKSTMDARRRRSHHGCYGRECGRRSHHNHYRGRSGRLLEKESGTKGSQKEKQPQIGEEKFDEVEGSSTATE